MQGVSGELYFGATMGFTVITDPDVRINTDRPKAMISDILVNHHSILFNSASHTGIGTEKGLTLKHNMTNVGFLFSSDNYLIPSKNRFKYRLLGYDNRWIETDASNRFAFYTKLPPGHYTLELTTANNDGLWSDEPLRLNIRRLPAPWLGPFALTAYIVLAFVALFAVFRHYDRQKQLKMALYRENFEKRQREELHQSQLSFFTSISHEFKTPLSLILAVTETLRREGLKEDYFRILDNNAGRLHQLVNELMLFRTVESGKQPLHIESVNVNALVTGIAEDFSDFARQRRFNYSIHPDRDLPEKIPADRMILEKIVINLLNNALRYTPDGGSVSITIYSDPKRYIPPYRHSHHEGNDPVDDPFYIVVHDTGVGISESSIRKIFERFYKVKTSDSQHLGTGIGLALVKSLTLLHKGSITVYSEREKGADMVVALSKNAANYRKQDFMEPAPPVEDLPADVAPEAKNDIRLAEPGNVEDLFLRESKRILIVEDNEDLRKLIAGFLSPYYTVVAASDGVAASDAIRDMEIDLIISDVMMPLKDGITLCRELKDSMNTSHIPLIMLTAKTGQTSRLEGIESGADVYLEKPVNFDMLLQVIRNIFKRQEKIREHYAKYFFVESSEISLNRQDNAFLKKLYDILDANIDNPELDVNYIASEMTMSKSKIYAKLKSVTGKSLVEIVLDYRLKKAAQLMLEEDLSVREVIMRVGIESQSYFTRMFKKEHGETPAAFAARHKKG
jgi:signal transduction histidine kinase/DNA-binding response OmpR family regulator